MEKIVKNVGFEVSVSFKARPMTTGKPLLHKDESSLGRKFINVITG